MLIDQYICHCQIKICLYSASYNLDSAITGIVTAWIYYCKKPKLIDLFNSFLCEKLEAGSKKLYL